VGIYKKGAMSYGCIRERKKQKSCVFDNFWAVCIVNGS